MLFRLIGSAFSPAGRRARLIVLIYHRVLAAPDAMLAGEIDATVFERQMALLASEFTVLPLGEATRHLAHGTLPARSVSITFDDGYADNEQVALPILKRHGLRATFFVSTGYSAGGMMFNDAIIETLRTAPAGVHDLSALKLPALNLGDAKSRRAAADRIIEAVKHRQFADREDTVERIAQTLLGGSPRIDLMMTRAQLANLNEQGMEIGAHTVRHPILAAIPDEEAYAEIVQSKRALEDVTGAPVTLFAYPNGKPGRDYDDRHVRFVKEAGFTAAVSTIPGIAHARSDLYQLPRVGPWERNPRRLAARLLLDCAKTAAH
jgi:peptidoglycan/xylan/chitin deacetylase (PgdA/CDA1 family)